MTPVAVLSPFPCPIRYEVEINRRTAAENEFVVLKKVRETGRAGGILEVP